MFAGIAIAFLFLVGKRLIGASFSKTLRAITGEIRDFTELKLSTGSINVIMFILLLAFGVFIIILYKLQEVIDFVVSYIGEEQAASLDQSMDLATLFFVLAIVIIVSLVAIIKTSRN